MSLMTNPNYLVFRRTVNNEYQSIRRLKDYLAVLEDHPLPPHLEQKVNDCLLPEFKFCPSCYKLLSVQFHVLYKLISEIDEERQLWKYRRKFRENS